MKAIEARRTMTATKLLSLHPVLAWIVYAVYLVLCQVYSLTPSPTAVLITLTGIVVWAYSNQHQP